jgi:hemerythrin-like domain-containing protein
MSGYADLLVSHIAKENNVLFRMADNTLSENEQKNLLVQFEAIEQNRSAGSRAEDYIIRINDLALFYKV